MSRVTTTAEPARNWRQELATWPNLISLLRLAAIPIFVWLLLGREDRASAAWLLAFLGATDWIDGWIARRFDQVSEIGKILDPTADRLMFLVAIASMMIDGSVPLWFAWAALAREAVVSVTAVVLGLLGARRIDVTWWGKTSTFGLMFAFPLFLASYADLSWSSAAEVLAWVIGIPSLILHYYAAAGYVPLAREAIRAGRSG